MTRFCCPAAVRLLLLGLVAAFSSPLPAQTLIDGFSGPTLDPAWDFPAVDVIGAGSGAIPNYDLATNPGQLTYTFTPHAGDDNPAAQFGLYRDDFSLANDGDYVQLTINIQSTTGALLQNFVGISLNATTTVPFDRSENYTMYARGDGRVDVVKGSAIVGNTGTGLYSVGDEVVLRFTRIDSTHVESSFSVDGGFAFSNFANITGDESEIAGFSAVGIYVGNNRKLEAGSVYLFDNLVYGNVNLESPGDFNDDGVVDARDYVVWRNNLDTDVDLPNDGLLTGPIGSDHYKMWKANYSGAVNAGLLLAPLQAVPEPATVVSLLVACGLAVAVTRRCRTSVN